MLASASGVYVIYASVHKDCIVYFDNLLMLFSPGAHGAGLTNMLFLREHSDVIELPLSPHIDRCYGTLATMLGHHYWVLPEIASHLTLNYTITTSSAAALVALVRHIQTRNTVTIVMVHLFNPIYIILRNYMTLCLRMHRT
jgi:hypothetical protein